MQPCACRDCFEISAAGIKTETEEIYNEEMDDWEMVTTVTLPMCWECEAAGCTPEKCQRSDAYSGTDDYEDAKVLADDEYERCPECRAYRSHIPPCSKM
jgi:hypothetical protein